MLSCTGFFLMLHSTAAWKASALIKVCPGTENITVSVGKGIIPVLTRCIELRRGYNFYSGPHSCRARWPNVRIQQREAAVHSVDEALQLPPSSDSFMPDGVLRIGKTGSDEVKEIPPVEDGLWPHLPFHSSVEAVSAHRGMTLEETRHRIIKTQEQTWFSTK